MTDRLRKAIAARNREIVLEAGIEVAMGLVFCLIIFGGVFVVAWLGLMFAGPARLDSGRTAQYALLVTGVYALVATFTAWGG